MNAPSSFKAAKNSSRIVQLQHVKRLSTTFQTKFWALTEPFQRRYFNLCKRSLCKPEFVSTEISIDGAYFSWHTVTFTCQTHREFQMDFLLITEKKNFAGRRKTSPHYRISFAVFNSRHLMTVVISFIL